MQTCIQFHNFFQTLLKFITFNIYINYNSFNYKTAIIKSDFYINSVYKIIVAEKLNRVQEHRQIYELSLTCEGELS